MAKTPPISLDEIFEQAAPKGSKKGRGATVSEPAARPVLTSAHRKTFDYLAQLSDEIKIARETLKEQSKGLAEKMVLKPAQISKILSIYLAERERGGAIEQQSAILEIAEQLAHGSSGASGESSSKASKSEKAD